MAHRAKFTDQARETFLEVLRASCNVTEAAKAAGVSRRCVYDHRQADAEFAAEWAEAEEEATDMLEREARRRALEGVPEPVFYQGVICGQVLKYSDRMMELLLKAHRPEKYKERVANEHTGKDGGPIETVDSTPTEIARRIAFALMSAKPADVSPQD